MMAAAKALRRSVSRLGFGLAASAAALCVITAAAAGTEEIDPAGPAAVRSLLIDPPRVTVRTFYHGQTVRVSGTAPVGHEVAIEIRGSEVPAELSVKGKVAGLIWANVEETTLDNMPSLYMLATSTSLQDLSGDTPNGGESVGYRVLESRSRVSPSLGPDENHRVITEFIKLKEDEELYDVVEGGVRLTPGSETCLDCAASFFIPPDVPVGNLTVRLLAFDRGHGFVVASADLAVAHAGLTATIATMARERGLLYGVLSVIVALAAGLLAGVVFGRGSKGGH
jgi:uncharacterized protein (TIGR02186 family)